MEFGPRSLGARSILASPRSAEMKALGNEKIKYPQPFDLPNEDTVAKLLNGVLDLGITLIDPAPAYGVSDLAMIAAEDGMNLTGALITHYHPDHCGGSMMGMQIEGVTELLALTQMPVHVQADEAEWVTKVTELTMSDLTTHSAGDAVMVGEIPIHLLHTPGHTPGSQCFFVNGCLVSGDTLFLDGCGRTDLPGGDPEALYYSLTQTLSQVPDDAVLFPGHMYSQEPAERLGDTRSRNVVFRPGSVEQWMMMFG